MPSSPPPASSAPEPAGARVTAVPASSAAPPAAFAGRRAQLPNATQWPDMTHRAQAKPMTTSNYTRQSVRGMKKKSEVEKAAKEPGNQITAASWLLLVSGLLLLLLLILFLWQFLELGSLRQDANLIRDEVFYTSDNTPFPGRVVVLDTTHSLFKMRETRITIDTDSNVSTVSSLTTSIDANVSSLTEAPQTRTTVLHGDDYFFPGYRPNDAVRILTAAPGSDSELAWSGLPVTDADDWGTIASTGLGATSFAQFAGPVLATGVAGSTAPVGSASGDMTVAAGTVPAPFNGFMALSGFSSDSAYRVSYQVQYQFAAGTIDPDTDAQFLLARNTSYSDVTFLSTLSAAVDGNASQGNVNNTSTIYLSRATMGAGNDETTVQRVGKTIVLNEGLLGPADYLSIWWQNRSDPLARPILINNANLSVEQIPPI